LLITLSILWGGSFLFVAIAVADLPPLTVVLIRVALAAATLWLVLLLAHIPLPDTREKWLSLLIMGLLNNVIPFALIVWGQQTITAGLASILNATTPIFTVLVAGALLSDERITPLRLVGVITGFTGIVYMLGPSAMEDSQSADTTLWAQLAIIGAASAGPVTNVTFAPKARSAFAIAVPCAPDDLFAM